jgi:catechol 2,3-dioxygenase-like lactoylglutathione lyase family enzyme
MTIPPAKLTAVTLGTRDLQATARFYEAIGFRRKFRATGAEIVFLDGGGVVLALWDWDKLAQDAVLSARSPPQSFRGATFAWNCATPAEVDAIFCQGNRGRRRPLAQAGKDRLRRLSRIFFRSGRTCLGSRAGARICLHRRRTFDTAGIGIRPRLVPVIYWQGTLPIDLRPIPHV